MTLTLTLPLSRLPGLTADLVHTTLANLLDEACFTVTGEGERELPSTAHDLARAASQLLSEEAEIRLYGDALGALTARLSEHSRALRIRAYELDPDQAHAGWISDDGHLKHGRLKPYLAQGQGAPPDSHEHVAGAPPGGTLSCGHEPSVPGF